MQKIFFCLFVSLGAFSQNLIEPKLEFVADLKVTVDKPLVVGQTAHGERRIIPITGGTFEGPKMKGVVLSGGADYQFVNKENTRTEIEAIYNLKTDDGVVIHIRNVGLVIKTKEQAEAVARGEQIDATKLYFRAAPKFDAPQESKYAWLNDSIFICTRLPSQGFVYLQVWRVL